MISEKEMNGWLSVRFHSFSFMYSMIFNRLSNAELADYHRLLDFYDQGCIIDIEVNIDDKESMFVDYALLSNLYYEIGKVAPAHCRFIIGPLIAHRVMIYISEKESVEDYTPEKREIIRDIAEQLKDIFIQKGNFSVYIGVGSYRPIEEILVSYDEAIRTVRYEKETKVCLVEEKDDYMRDMTEYSELKEKFLSSIKYGEENSFGHLTALVEHISVLNMDAQRNLVLELVVLAAKEVYDHEAREDNYIDFMRYASELSHIQTVEELQSWCYKTFRYIMKVLRQRHMDRRSYILKNVLGYMEQHYMEELTLQDAADKAGMTPQYFSTLFKQTIGMNFVEWLATHRIKKAMEYLDEPGAMIKEVCFKVGYNDPNYFSRIFKKIKGITPKEYISGKV